MTTHSRVEIVIDRVVVHGVDRAGARIIAAALATRLEEVAGRWVDEPGSAPSASCVEPLRQLPATTQSPIDQVGNHVADAVERAITQPRATPLQATPTRMPATRSGAGS